MLIALTAFPGQAQAAAFTANSDGATVTTFFGPIPYLSFAEMTVKIEVRLFDELVETFDLERPDEVLRLVDYMNYHSRNRRYKLKKVSSLPSGVTSIV